MCERIICLSLSLSLSVCVCVCVRARFAYKLLLMLAETNNKTLEFRIGIETEWPKKIENESKRNKWRQKL